MSEAEDAQTRARKELEQINAQMQAQSVRDQERGAAVADAMKRSRDYADAQAQERMALLRRIAAATERTAAGVERIAALLESQHTQERPRE
jgi:uncharacterized protein YlxW (UPF0749 family)